ncbi:DEAD/DEAH box helicase [Terrihabitans rhizophilus]|uniref:DEAD/DEAH box helicase n=1 Tax=Terrihabitans rhizophilus TaxID=3092662 RepID=A0ABU4RXI9_9HYPH|nr:DEAD/DEAH box helicase [Terrihabitans sp. PJ23]MDX6807631.1 DEAD/DEAH box helicase [Terrihabitans sp. PJ23]
MTTFAELGLHPAILKALTAEGYENPTPIQEKAIPFLMQGRDLLGIAQTGTGKTAAFALPILHRLASDKKVAPRRSCRALVLSPTRELASQIAASFRSYGKGLGLSVEVIFGGVSAGPQARALAAGIDVLVATPGRLLDHLNGGMLKLEPVEVFVLDEADQMLDMGFIRDIRKVVAKLPKNRQSLFFSATMPKEIGVLAAELLRDPQEVAVTPVAKTADRVEQRMAFVDNAEKRPLLVNLLKDRNMDRVLVFSRTKHGADKIAKYLVDAGIDAAAIHGNKSQGARERALGSFKAGKTRALVATDIAARGIDVDGVSHVVNFDLPNVPESYVHRIGRTARAGASGMAISFCAPDERPLLRDIEKLIQQQVPALEGHEKAHAEAAAAGPATGKRNNSGGRNGQNNNRGGGRPQQGRPQQNGRPGGPSREDQNRGPRREQRSGEQRQAGTPGFEGMRLMRAPVRTQGN